MTQRGRIGVTLEAFVAARLDEDEAAAKAAASVAGPDWEAETYWPEDESRTRTCVRSVDGAFLGEFDDTPDHPDMAAHVARHDPARVLREVEAKRAILAEHPVRSARNITRQVCTDVEGTSYLSYLSDEHTKAPPPCPTLRALAAVYRDHPDYDPAWCQP